MTWKLFLLISVSSKFKMWMSISFYFLFVFVCFFSFLKRRFPLSAMQNVRKCMSSSFAKVHNETGWSLQSTNFRYNVPLTNRSAGGTSLFWKSVSIQPMKQKYNRWSFLYVYTNKLQKQMKWRQKLFSLAWFKVISDHSALLSKFHTCKSCTRDICFITSLRKNNVKQLTVQVFFLSHLWKVFTLYWNTPFICGTHLRIASTNAFRDNLFSFWRRLIQRHFES